MDDFKAVIEHDHWKRKAESESAKLDAVLQAFNSVNKSIGGSGKAICGTVASLGKVISKR